MPFVELRSQQPVSGDDRQINAVGNRHEEGTRIGIEGRNRLSVARINGNDTRFFKHDFRLVIAELVELVRDRVPFGLRCEYADCFLGPESDSIDFKAPGDAAFIAEGIVGNL